MMKTLRKYNSQLLTRQKQLLAHQQAGQKFLLRKQEQTRKAQMKWAASGKTGLKYAKWGLRTACILTGLGALLCLSNPLGGLSLLVIGGVAILSNSYQMRRLSKEKVRGFSYFSRRRECVMMQERAINPHPQAIWKYLAWTFGWSWGIWLLAILLKGLFSGQLVNWLMPLTLLASFGPALGAKMVLRLSFRELWAYIFSGRSKTWLSLLFLMLMETVVYCFASKGWNPNRPLWLLPVLFVFVLICGGGNEELGWRGFLQPALEKRFSFWQATVLTGLSWLVWHLPLWFIPGSSQAGTSFLVFIADLLLISFVFAGLYKHSQSVWHCCLLHAFNNTIAGSFSHEGFNHVIYFAGIGLMAVYAGWLWHRTDLTDKEENL